VDTDATSATADQVGPAAGAGEQDGVGSGPGRLHTAIASVTASPSKIATTLRGFWQTSAGPAANTVLGKDNLLLYIVNFVCHTYIVYIQVYVDLTTYITFTKVKVKVKLFFWFFANIFENISQNHLAARIAFTYFVIHWTPGNSINVLQGGVGLSNLSDYRVLPKIPYRLEFFRKKVPCNPINYKSKILFVLQIILYVITCTYNCRNFYV